MCCGIPCGQVSLIGTGVNLTRATRLFIIDMDWLESSLQQAIFRINRYGQLNETFTEVLRCSAVLVDNTIFDNHLRRRGLMTEVTRTLEEIKANREAKRAANAILQALKGACT